MNRKMAVSTPVRSEIDRETLLALRAFLRRIETHYPVRKAILYGSRARGEHRPDSDADLAVVLDGRRGDRSAVVRDMASAAFHVMMETGVMVEAFPFWEDELDPAGGFANSRLIENIRRDGVRV